jgi:hypothetical protein
MKMACVSDLLQRAQSHTGLTKFGENSFIEGLEILVAATDREAELTDAGRAEIEALIVDLLCNRLRIEDWYGRHPEIDDQEIVAPLIGLGLPRTGSTALACLLAEDPHARFVRNWEAQSPCPPPEPATSSPDPRVAMSEAFMARRVLRFPRMVAMLPNSATSPTECQTFMGYDFKSQIFQAMVNVPSYTEWLNHKADLTSTYRYLKRVLKLLQWRWPTYRWRLKNPSHSLFIEALNQVFPDARFVMTHRDVGSVVPSVADLYFEMRKAFSDTVDLKAIGRVTSDFCQLGMRRMIAFRDGGENHRFFDIHFIPFQQDPFPAISALYEFLGEQLTPEACAGMEAWRRSKPLDEQGYARTNPAAFGLDRDELRRVFQFYTDRFGVTEKEAVLF